MSLIKVKGTGVISTKTYVEKNHHNEYKTWLNSLPLRSKEIYSNSINATDWYNIEDAYLAPMKNIASKFYNGDEQAAGLSVGRFSADYGLKGVYKVFLLIATPQALMRASKRIISVYFDNVEVTVDKINKKALILNCTKITNRNELFNYRTIGWCVRALELANCKNVVYEHTKAPKPNMFSIKLSWD